ncbi:ABC transporter substrate-binding protein [Rhodopila sp.]|jgi:NitT/TauT family transport system substrate-binding protein|uniref:ABC transporter substrate-binding protein n=1 Tax=Rhodopila sp. TaxID=2480087 RepID=UPI002BF393C6|nr:ABC transporter substrate-binding protein [Rhodopila sp.]HVZ10719.1 ABC transporter substrate-binding protein [Rhodopila sp.]
MNNALTRRKALIAGTAAVSLADAVSVRAETNALRVSYGYSTGYLPLMIMRDQKLIEKHAAKIGLGSIDVTWQVLDGGNNINDAMLAGALDISGIGVPGYLVLRDRTLGRKQEMVGISALTSGALWLNTIEPRIRTLVDYTPKDRIAMPGIKTSFAAVVLQMAVAKQFGIENYARLDPNTVGMPHPEAYAAMMSGKTEITSHLASAPFSYLELKDPKVHRVFTTRDVIGPMSILMTMTQRSFAEANPGLVRAFLAAQEEASAFITQDHEGAAAVYTRVSQTKTAHDQVIQVLDDAENEYSVVPAGSLNYAQFLAAIGSLKQKPAAWTELFLPMLKDRNGS